MLAGPQLRCSLDFAEMLAAELAGLDDSVRGGAGGEGDVEASRLVCALLVLARGARRLAVTQLLGGYREVEATPLVVGHLKRAEARL